jgi:hypothetical protein
MTNYPKIPKINKLPLPDLFTDAKGIRSVSVDAWEKQAAFWREQIIDLEYGGMPPAPSSFEIETLCHSQIKRWEGQPFVFSYRLHSYFGEQRFSFTVRVILPQSPGPHPVIIAGDGCWWYASDEVIQEVLSHRYALILFNRTEMAEDLGVNSVVYHNPEPYWPRGQRFTAHADPRRGGLYDFFPEKTFGAVAAWAWGYHRCVDLIHQLPYCDNARIAITGHSRGGKTVLVAGATDTRIALVNDNQSCAGGSALFRYVGDSAETLTILDSFPSWFGKGLRPYLGKEEGIPFDQHCLLASMAPQALLCTYSMDDRWANPEGMVLAVEAAREAYDLLGVGDRLAFHLRTGAHSHAPEDWQVLLDFMAWQWKGEEPGYPYNQHPYRHLDGLLKQG